MSETPETPPVRSSTATAPAAAPVEAAPYHIPRVFQFAAWVAIVAGIVFIVATIFFFGLMLGHAGHHGHHHHHAAWMHPHRMGGPGGQGGPGAGGPAGVPGGGPASVTPGAPGPGQIPSSVAPSRTP